MLETVSPALLLLIDLQASFCDEEGSMARQGRDISGMQAAAGQCNALAGSARRHGVSVAWTRMVFAPDYSDGGVLTAHIRPNLARIGALARGSGDELLWSGAQTDSSDIVFDKPRYSALYATPLEAILRAGNIRHVIVAGVTTSMCVESTVRDLGQRDYRVHVVEEACADFSDRHAASIAAMGFGFGEIVSFNEAEDLMRRLGSGEGEV